MDLVILMLFFENLLLCVRKFIKHLIFYKLVQENSHIYGKRDLKVS